MKFSQGLIFLTSPGVKQNKFLHCLTSLLSKAVNTLILKLVLTSLIFLINMFSNVLDWNLPSTSKSLLNENLFFWISTTSVYYDWSHFRDHVTLFLSTECVFYLNEVASHSHLVLHWKCMDKCKNIIVRWHASLKWGQQILWWYLIENRKGVNVVSKVKAKNSKMCFRKSCWICKISLETDIKIDKIWKGRR
jgi:hypothetical protein